MTPSDPTTPLADGASSMHELYLALKQAGFTDQQAIYLVGQALAAAATKDG